MKTLLLSVLAVLLVACSAPFTTIGEAGTSEVEDVTPLIQPDAPVNEPTTPRGVVDGGTDAVAEASSIDSGNQAELEACRARACSNAGAECGSIPATCGGQAVECGSCPVSYDRCGDKTENRCGHACLSSFTTTCMVAGKPSEWGVRWGCQQPYRIEGSAKVLRPNGLEGCVYYQVPNGGPEDFYSCCP